MHSTIVEPGGPGQSGDPTVIVLDEFKTVSEDDHITIIWKTLSEIDTLGFNLWRSEDANGEYNKITSAPITPTGGVTLKAEYTFIDDTTASETLYYYKLEEIDTEGKNTFYGPISSTKETAEDTTTTTNNNSTSEDGEATKGGCFLESLPIILKQLKDEGIKNDVNTLNVLIFIL